MAYLGLGQSRPLEEEPRLGAAKTRLSLGLRVEGLLGQAWSAEGLPDPRAPRGLGWAKSWRKSPVNLPWPPMAVTFTLPPGRQRPRPTCAGALGPPHPHPWPGPQEAHFRQRGSRGGGAALSDASAPSLSPECRECPGLYHFRYRWGREEGKGLLQSRSARAELACGCRDLLKEAVSALPSWLSR